MATKFIVKCGIAGGIVYQSVDQGLWGSSSRTIELYEDLSKLVEPVTKEVKQKIELPDLPTSGEVGFIATYYWNAGVKATFAFLKELPTNTARLGCKSYNYIVNHPEIKKLQEPTETQTEKK
ncbi:MICOS complex subunit MIC13 homolog QIL1-like [Ctenocephalides felis]|uniref:MICOS complex subunit MIC13 homolog QIL1-like n=1 Tax=Ctenocephalides felis TaxID=7515 RepID=UPI000E6E5B55|nr:MICOS complex subunit MIC13 homolog QIL1-like [Ctenocephalides felis]